MEGSYNWVLVFASYCVAVIASYTAIYVGTRVFDLSGRSRRFWQAAFYDSLTGLANRSLLEMRVLEKLTVSDANKVPAAFMLGYFELSDYRDLS